MIAAMLPPGGHGPHGALQTGFDNRLESHLGPAIHPPSPVSRQPLKLKRAVTKHFWLNVNDPSIDIPGIVEFSNLRRLPDTVVYVPYYMPQGHPKFSKPAEYFVAEAMAYVRKLNPAIGGNDLIASHVGDPPGANADRGTADRRHLLLLP
jgi:hypothetical protein